VRRLRGVWGFKAGDPVWIKGILLFGKVGTVVGRAPDGRGRWVVRLAKPFLGRREWDVRDGNVIPSPPAEWFAPGQRVIVTVGGRYSGFLVGRTGTLDRVGSVFGIRRWLVRFDRQIGDIKGFGGIKKSQVPQAWLAPAPRGYSWPG